MQKEEETLDIRQVPEAVLLKAVQTMFSDCYGALRIANAVGGEQTPKWQLLHTFNRDEIMEEVTDRKLDISQLTTAIGDAGELVTASKAYRQMYPEKP